MTNVCFVSPYAYYFFSHGRAGRVGGAELDLFLVSTYLAKDPNFSVSCIVADFGQGHVEVNNKVTLYKSFPLARTPLNLILAPFHLWRAMRQANADVYICATAWPETGLTALFARLMGKKFIYRTAHELDCNRTYVKKNGIFGRIFEYGLLHANRIFTSVRNHEDILHETYGDRIKHIQFVPYGVEVSGAKEHEKDFILWVARGEKWKNPQLFIDLAQEFPKEKFVMIMPKKQEEHEFYEQIKANALQTKNITFIEGVPFEKIQPYFDKAKVFVNTTDQEGFTFTIMQSGQARTPVLYFKVNPDNIISDNKLGFWADGDIKKLKDGLKQLIEDKAEWQKRSNNIYNYILDKHDIRKNVKIWSDLLS